MVYRCLYPVEKGNSRLDFQYAGASGSGRLLEEPLDHGLELLGTSKHIDVISRSGGLELSGDLAIKIYMSRSRIAFYCEKYDKGSMYSGFGIGAVGLVMTAVSKANAKKRSEGMALAGHIRFEWLKGLSFDRKKSFLTDDSITFHYNDTDAGWCLLHFSFPKGTETDKMAHTIIKNACRYKLAMSDTKTSEQAGLLSAYCQGKRIDPSVTGSGWKEEGLKAYQAPEGEEYRPDPKELIREE